LNSTSDEERNLEQAEGLIVRAAGYGAAFVATPENTNFLGPHDQKVARAQELDGPVCKRFSRLAKDLGIHLLLGSFNEKGNDGKHCRNTSVLFAPDGERLALYRKIHLFDIDLPGEIRFLESDTVEAGGEAVVAPTELARFGMSICYDLRFAELYRRLRQGGAEILLVPSAFTQPTGRAHWFALLRARAIENQCYLIAPAQVGRHDDQGLRESYGHAAIVGPWGTVLATAADGPGVALAEIDLERVASVRRSMPVEDHRRL
ncbi:MAG TPA: carbon-nitrogen hydrolase family protein, partial [Thermoanaerobaculia bacterium]|nr:carbon-nitrogen hydrolase family protein [Thermoanaerobaculia bacterium]